MIVRLKDIYKQVSVKTEVPLEVVQSIGTTILASLRANMSYAEDISYELRHIGIFNVKQTKFKKYVEAINAKIARGDLLLDTEERIAEYARRNRLYNKILNFKSKKTEKRTLRYEQIEANQSSQSNS